MATDSHGLSAAAKLTPRRLKLLACFRLSKSTAQADNHACWVTACNKRCSPKPRVHTQTLEFIASLFNVITRTYSWMNADLSINRIKRTSGDDRAAERSSQHAL